MCKCLVPKQFGHSLLCYLQSYGPTPTYCLQQRTIDELEGGHVFVHTMLMAAVCVCMCVCGDVMVSQLDNKHLVMDSSWSMHGQVLSVA